MKKIADMEKQSAVDGTVWFRAEGEVDGATAEEALDCSGRG